MGKLRPFVRKDSYMPNKKWIPFVIGNGYTTTDGASGPAPEYETVTGNPVSFNAITPFPLRKLEVAFSPVQDLHGYDAPWPAGGGANLRGDLPLAQDFAARFTSGTLDTTNKTFTFPYNTTEANEPLPSVPTFEENTQYTFILTMKNDGIARTNLQILYTDGTSSYFADLSGAGVKQTVALASTAGKTVKTLARRQQGGATIVYYEESGVFKGVLTASQFTPYSNLCPISGWDSLNVEQRGKNLYPYETIPAYTYAWYSGSKALADATQPVFLKGGGNYILSWVAEDPNRPPFVLIRAWRSDGTILSDSPSTLRARLVGAQTLFAWQATPQYYQPISSAVTPACFIQPTEDLWLDIRTQANLGAGQTPQLELGETATAYTPYNPSSRSISITFPAMGANQWDEEWENARINLTTGEIASGNGLLSKNLIPAVPNTQYHAVSGSYTGGSSFVFAYYDADGNYLNYEVKFGMSVNFTTPANARFIRFNIQTPDAVTYNHDIAINYPATVTTYSPYTNTVYSGTLDLVTGEGTVTMASVDLGTLSWFDSTDGGGHSVFGAVITDKARGAFNVLCEIYPTVKSGHGYASGMDDRTIGGVGNSNYLYARDDSYSGYTAFKTAMSGVQLVYELATPIPIQLTPQEVESLAGDNNLWSDANQPLTVTYRSN